MTKAERSFDPYQEWLKLDAGQHGDRDLLGVASGANREDIDQAYHRRYAQIRQYQVGTYATDAIRILQELSQAHHRLIAHLSSQDVEDVGREKTSQPEFDFIDTSAKTIKIDASPVHPNVVAFDDDEAGSVTERSSSGELVADSRGLITHAEEPARNRRNASSRRKRSGNRRVYYMKTVDGRREGPISRRRLKKYAKYGLIQADTLIWKESWERPKLAVRLFPDLDPSTVDGIPNVPSPELPTDTGLLPQTDSRVAVAVLIGVVSVAVLGLGGYIAWSVSNRSEPPRSEQVRQTAREPQKPDRNTEKKAKAAPPLPKSNVASQFEATLKSLRGHAKKRATAPTDTVTPQAAKLRISESLRFSGWHHVKMPAAAEILDIEKDFFIETWIRWPLSPGVQQVILDCESRGKDGGSPSGWSLRTLPAAPGFQLEFRAAADEHWSSFQSIVLARKINWQHLAVARCSKQFLMFVDGTLVGATEINSEHVTPRTSLFIGSQEPSGPRRLDAHLRAVRISNICRFETDFRPAWQLEVDNNAVLHYDFTKRTGKQVNDRSSSRRHGSIHGAIWMSE